MSEDEVGALLLKRAAKHTGGRKGSSGVMAWCRHHGIAKGHVSEFLAGKRAPVTAILDALEWRIEKKRRRRCPI